MRADSRPVPAVDEPIEERNDPQGASWISRLLRFDRDGDRFVAVGPEGAGGRLFGGLIAAQALGAACSTVIDDKLPQSLHLYFVRGGQPDVDVEFYVERTRDGRSFDTRRVTATQRGSVILEMLGSFHRPEPGADSHPPAPAMFGLDDTTDLLVPGELANRFDIRAPKNSRGFFTGPPYWIRSRGAIEDDPVTRACALTYMSDIALMAAARPPDTPLVLDAGMAASLDHSIWFHRPFHAEEWHQYQTTSLNNNDSRGLVLGAFYDSTGMLVATIAQEALWRR